MYDSQFTQTVLTYLLCANTQGKEESIVAAFYAPLSQVHTFGIESNGIVDLKKQETGSRRTILRPLTPDHVAAFKENLIARLAHYHATVEHNKQVSRSYETPTFGLDDVVAMTQDALLESFKGVRESYRGK